ncbi:MAG: glycosyltransferase family 9 protein [Bacteroidota bacterium]|nr:glycosyltransferase family 9 protein [Bacteroidota bacterium]
MQKILVVRFSSIGDIVLTTPVVRCLKRQLGDVEVHYLTKKQFLPVLQHNPYISKIITISKNVSEVADVLKKEDYSFIVDLHSNLRTMQVKNRLRKPSASFKKLNFKKWLLVNTKINRMPDVHIVDRYFEAVKSLGVVNDGEGLDYFIDKKDEAVINELPEKVKNNYVAIVIGGQHKTKLYPSDKIVALCDKLQMPVIILGGPEDESEGDWIVENSIKKDIYNACGKFSLNKSAALISFADVVVSNDTGLMHIAAAFKKKIVSIWGNTVPEFGMYPYLPKKRKNYSVIIEEKGLSCRPCSKIGYKKCPKGHFNCMNNISEDRIIDAIKSVKTDY